VENFAQAYLGLSKEDVPLLRAIELGMKDHEWVPLSPILQLSGLSARKAVYRLGQLYEQKLILRETRHYEGYQIGFDAYDILALSDFAEQGSVQSVGCRIGVGKEAVVYAALGKGPLALKFHRQGRTSFKRVRRLRDHLTDLPRASWLYGAAIAAQHEFGVLEKLYPKVAVPKPVAQSRHALAMERLEGDLLCRITLANPGDCLEMILEEVQKTWRLGIVHADLSEFNVLVSDDGPRIIDWPQAVESSHPHARELLQRDIGNILRFFERRYQIEMLLEGTVESVMGEAQQA